MVQNIGHLALRNLLANAVSHQIAKRCWLLERGAGLCAHVQFELSAIDSGKEVLPEPWEQREGCETCREEADSEHDRMGHCVLQQVVISASQLFKVVFVGELKMYQGIAALLFFFLRTFVMCLQKKFGHRWNDGS